MKPLIGVTHPTALNKQAKRELLFFDKLAVLNLEELDKLLRAPEFEGSNDWLADEFSWMEKHGLVIKAEVPEHSSVALEGDLLEMHKKYLECVKTEENYKGVVPIVNGKRTIDPTVPANKINSFLRNHWRIITLQTRLMALAMRQTSNLEAYSLLSSSNSFQDNMYTSKSDILRIVLKDLPVPDDQTPYEAILDYRKDVDSNKKVVALRNWISDIAKGDFNKNEIEEKIEYLVNSYRDHVKAHEIKHHKGIIEVVVVTSLEVIENIIKIKWSKVAKSLFSIWNGQGDLMQAELSAPGSHLAYIAKTNDTFTGNDNI